jgi:Ca2+-binding RTX toxin-like protein
VQLTWSPSWSPDGTELAYTEGSALDVVAIHPDGSGRRVVAGGTGVDAAPAWSPDGTQIALLHAAPGGVPMLHVVAAAGGPLRRLTSTEIAYGFQPPAPAWSPDGTLIAFTATQIVGYTRYGPIVSSAVHVVDAEGTLEHRLTADLAPPGFESPAWSPDGRRILFHAVPGGPAFLMNTDGTCESRVSDRPGGPASWQPVDGPPSPYLRCADLEVRVLDNDGAVAAGGAETFQVAVKNLENEPATGVRLTSAAPEHGSLESASADRGSCSLAGGSLSCDLGQLPVGEDALVTITIRAAGVGVVSTTVQASANEPDGARGNNGARLAFEALPCGRVAREDGGVIVGTFGPDRICGRSGQDVIYALGGNDMVDAGPQADRVFPGPGRDSVFLRAGADFADSRDGQPDTIVCGGERDLVLVDRLDRTSKDCEHVERPRIHRCKTIGTVRSDELVGTSLADEVCALSGNDEIHTLAGNDAIDAGSGNDTIDGGKGRDVVLAGEGYDTIFARDSARDRIRCGPQDDLVFADRHDLVAADCERVRRR